MHSLASEHLLKNGLLSDVQWSLYWCGFSLTCIDAISLVGDDVAHHMPYKAYDVPHHPHHPLLEKIG